MAQRTATTDTAEVTGRSATARGRPALGQGASPALDRYDRLFVATAFGIQVVLLLFFALRVWAFDAAMRVGWLVYALAVPALLVSAVLRGGRKPWYHWLAGVLYAGWALGGYVVDIARPVAWRAPIVWPVFLPYVALYLAAQMLYWWPLGTIRRPLWYAYAALFAASTALNLASHG